MKVLAWIMPLPAYESLDPYITSLEVDRQSGSPGWVAKCGSPVGLLDLCVALDIPTRHVYRSASYRPIAGLLCGGLGHATVA